MTMIFEADFGTPASKKSDLVSLEIDGRAITVQSIPPSCARA